MIVARMTPADSSLPEDLNRIVGLRFDPFPGDTIALTSGQVVRVIRRQLNELWPDADDQIDVTLVVRMA